MKTFEFTYEADKFSRFEKYNMYARINDYLKSHTCFPIILMEDVRQFFAYETEYLDEVFQVKDETLKEQIRREGVLVGTIEKCNINSTGDCTYSCSILDSSNNQAKQIAQKIKRVRDGVVRALQEDMQAYGGRASLLAGVVNQMKQVYALDQFHVYDGSYPVKIYISTLENLKIGDSVTIQFSKEERGLIAIYRGKNIGSMYPMPARRVLYMLDDNLQIKGKVCDVYKTGVNILTEILSASMVEQARREIEESKK